MLKGCFPIARSKYWQDSTTKQHMNLNSLCTFLTATAQRSAAGNTELISFGKTQVTVTQIESALDPFLVTRKQTSHMCSTRYLRLYEISLNFNGLRLATVLVSCRWSRISPLNGIESDSCLNIGSQPLQTSHTCPAVPSTTYGMPSFGNLAIWQGSYDWRRPSVQQPMPQFMASGRMLLCFMPR